MNAAIASPRLRAFPGRTGCLVAGAALLIALLPAPAGAAADRKGKMHVSFSQSATTVAAQDFVEVTLSVREPAAANPFTDVDVSGEFALEGAAPVRVAGFCDAQDGTLYRIRFLPARAGRYTYRVTLRHGEAAETHAGTFRARDERRRGVVRVDREHPWHFLWEGTGEHYFWNGTTTYWLMGWDDETIRRSIERLHTLKVNRLRVAIAGRVEDGHAWYENVYPTDRFTFLLDPWVAARPDSVADPGFDVARFNVAYWQKYERLLRHARERDVAISVVFYVDGRRPGVDPFGKERAGGEEEQRFYRYAAARFSAFANVMWDVSNEYRHFRDDAWAKQMGKYLKEQDPYDHLMSVHGFHDFRFRTEPWADFAMYQQWDEHGGHDFMLKNRREQAATGRPIPQVNEEYGYEDHYPAKWGEGRTAPARSADNRRRLAWEMCMAGGYQTTGERADTGTGWGPDTGGGWINGRGDDSMVMLRGYAHMVAFFTGFEWWKADPRPDLVSAGAHCLAEPGRQYVLYLPKGGTAMLALEPGTYRARWYNPRTGRFLPDLPAATGAQWTSPSAPDSEDWALLLTRAA